MHQCLKCKKTYEDDEVPLLKGCECGESRLFLYIKDNEDIELVDKYEKEITEKIEEIKRMEVASKLHDSAEAHEEPKEVREKTVFPGKFGVETIKTKDIGIYEINLDALMRGRPIIVLSKGGSYIISLPSMFGKREEIKLR